jgi:hypothetical protein
MKSELIRVRGQFVIGLQRRVRGIENGFEN